MGRIQKKRSEFSSEEEEQKSSKTEEGNCDRTTQNNSILSPKPVHMAIKQ
jgi:hypothetical protein